MSDILLIGSCEPFSGKSAMVLGIAKRLLQEKKKVRIGKPLATCIELTNLPSISYEGLIDDDVKFIGSTLNIEDENLISSVGLLDNISAEKRIFNKDLLPGKGFNQIEGLVNDDFEGLNILEAAGSLHEGMVYGLSLPQLAKDLDAEVLIVNLWEDCKSVDALLDAKKQLGEKLAGVVLNGVLPQEVEKVINEIIPALKDLDIEGRLVSSIHVASGLPMRTCFFSCKSLFAIPRTNADLPLNGSHEPINNISLIINKIIYP